MFKIKNQEMIIFINFSIFNYSSTRYVRTNKMGLYQRIKENLPKQFSIFQVMSLFGISSPDVRTARNILKQLYQQGLIKRISRNMYQRIAN